jgi:DNA-directed RNA polymerase subunit M/transcription elongation factor TFIIS
MIEVVDERHEIDLHCQQCGHTWTVRLGENITPSEAKRASKEAGCPACGREEED